MRPNHEILNDINPYSSHDVEGWSESPAGQRTLTQVLERAAKDMTPSDRREEHRRRPWLVAATAAAVVLALAIPVALVMRSQDGVSPGGGIIPFGGLWILDSFTVNGEFTTVEIGVNSAELPFIEFGPQVIGNTGCNNFSVSEANFTPESGTLILEDVAVDTTLCGEEDGKGLMRTPRAFREAMGNPWGFDVSTVDDTMQWLLPGSTRLFFVRDDVGIELTADEGRQIPGWVNQVGLAQFHPVLWRDRLDRMCGEGVWNPDVAVRLSAEFINTDLEAGTSVRVEGIGPPLAEDGALALWFMAANTCKDRFPTGAIEQGPPSFGGPAESSPEPGAEVPTLLPVRLGDGQVWPEKPQLGRPTEIAIAFANDVLGWQSPSATELSVVDASGQVWVRLILNNDAVPIDVLTVPTSERGGVITQVQVAWGTATSVRSIEPDQPGSEIVLVGARGTVSADVTIRLADGKQLVVTATREDIGNGRVEIPQVSDPTDIRTVLIRYLNAKREVISATGGSTSAPTSGSEVSGLPPVLLGASHLWPEEPFVGQPSDVAAAFAVEVLGWDSPSANADPRADPSGDVWVRIAQEGVAELVDVLTVPAPTGGRTLSQIGVPWAKGVSVDTLGTGQPGSRIGLIRVRDAEVAEVAIQLGDGSQVIVMADREDIGSGWLEVPGIPDPREIGSVLIRYLDAENRVIAATGESF